MAEVAEHPNGLAAKDPQGTHEPVWGVWRVGLAGDVTFGPMSREEADRMAAGPFGGHVFCFACNHQSPCGPWAL